MDKTKTRSRCLDSVPKGQAKIAQRFNAGMDIKRLPVPKGRLRFAKNPSTVPSGLASEAVFFPALKRRAILTMSLRDKATRRVDRFSADVAVGKSAAALAAAATVHPSILVLAHGSQTPQNR